MYVGVHAVLMLALAWTQSEVKAQVSNTDFIFSGSWLLEVVELKKNLFLEVNYQELE